MTEDRWVGYVALVGVAVGAFAVYVARPAWPYLATGVVAVTAVVPQVLLDWTDDELGPAGVLLATGVTLLVAALFGLRLRKEVVEAPEDRRPARRGGAPALRRTERRGVRAGGGTGSDASPCPVRWLSTLTG